MQRLVPSLPHKPQEPPKVEEKPKPKGLDKIKNDIDNALKPLKEMTMIREMEKKTGLTTLGLVLGSFILLIYTLFLSCNIHGSFLSDIPGFLYPTYLSLEALEAKKDNDLWISYWILFGLFKFLENFEGYLLTVLPFYYLTKVVLIFWLVHPKSQGALALYQIGLKHWVPLFKSIFTKPKPKEQPPEEKPKEPPKISFSSLAYTGRALRR